MRCDEARRLMPLYTYGELAPADEERFEAHVHGCEPCRMELQKETRFNQLLDNATAPLPEGILTASRLELRSRLADEPQPHGFRAWLRDTFWFRVNAAPAWMQAAGALALIAAGFASGRVAPGGGGFGASEAGIAGKPVASQIRYLEPDDSGSVQVVVDETHERVFRGSLHDEPIRRLLLAATHDGANPALRVQSVELLKNDCRSSDIRTALLNALQHDPDPGVRLEALDVLKEFASEPEMRDTFSRVLLADGNPGVRMQVIGLLLNQRPDEMVGVFQELMRREDDVYVRQKCRRALVSMNASAEEY